MTKINTWLERAPEGTDLAITAVMAQIREAEFQPMTVMLDSRAWSRFIKTRQFLNRLRKRPNLRILRPTSTT